MVLSHVEDLNINAIFFIPSFAERHINCLQFLVVMNRTAINMFEQMSLLYVLESLGYMPKSDIADLAVNRVPSF